MLQLLGPSGPPPKKARSARPGLRGLSTASSVDSSAKSRVMASVTAEGAPSKDWADRPLRIRIRRGEQAVGLEPSDLEAR
eukprot:jgi/Botrbrau1/10609/Bobra.0358s0028.1